MEADDLVAQQLGAASASQMTDVQEQYKDAIKRKLEEVGGPAGAACTRGGAGRQQGWHWPAASFDWPLPM